MKKVIYVIGVILILWLIKLSYDLYAAQQQLSILQESQHKADQVNANLNDQLIALQRNSTSTTVLKDQKKNSKISETQFNPTKLLLQKLELVQFSLDQHQFIYAIDQLGQVERMIGQYELADTLKLSLQRALEQDQKMIQQYVVSRNAQLTQIGDLLENIDVAIKNEQKNQKLEITSKSEQSLWQRWFKVERIEQQTPALLNRRLILKEIQLRILFAQHALQQGQYLDYQTMLNLVIEELNQLPDAEAAKLKKRIQNLQQIQLLPAPKLNSKAILEA